MHDVKDSRMSVQLPLTDTAVTKTTQHISAVNSVTEGGGGNLSFNIRFFSSKLNQYI